jgi:hypothetical protein
MKRTIAITGLVILVGIFTIVPSVLMYNAGRWEGVGLFWGIIAIAVILASALHWCINNSEL